MVGFDLYVSPFFMLLKDISYVLLFYIIQHFGHVNNEQVGQFIVEPPHFSFEGSWM